MDASRNVVVIVRGAGGEASGEPLRVLADALPGSPGHYKRSGLALGREVYPRLASTAPALPDLIEVGPVAARPQGFAWGAWLRRLLSLAGGLVTVRFDWCPADPARRARELYRDVAEGLLLWTVWPVLLTLAHTVAAPAARPNRMVLDLLVLGLLGWLVRVQRAVSGRTAVAGCVWLGLCLVLCCGLWGWPRWTASATIWSIRAYGLGQLLGALALLGVAAEIGIRVARRRLSWRQGLAAFAVSLLPFGLVSLLSACLWAAVLNASLALGTGPVLDALRNWQQTFAGALGYHLAAVEWGGAAVTVLVVLLGAAGGLHARWVPDGRSARRWLLAALVAMALGTLAVALAALLTSPYLRAPLANSLRPIGAGADVATIYTWSAFRALPWALLLLTPLGGLLAALADIGLQLAPPDGAGPSTRRENAERLARLLAFLDQGRYGHIHLLAHGQGSLVALQALQGAEWRHRVVLTTLGSPAGPLYRDLLGWPTPTAPAGVEWRNLYRRGDPLGGPVGDETVDAPLEGGGHGGYWAEPQVVARVVAAMQPPG